VTHNRCVNFQFTRSKTKLIGRQNLPKMTLRPTSLRHGLFKLLFASRQW